VADFDRHPLPRFLAAGVSCALNSDDRALFDLNLVDEYARAEAVHGLDPRRAAAMQHDALAAAFCDDATGVKVAPRLPMC
jgi:adenosine deaminase